jgi:hypothetical protein
VQRIESTLAWRRQMRVDDLEGSFADIEEEFGCGSLFNMGYTPNGLPAIIIIPNRNHMSNEKRNLALPVSSDQ